MASLNSENVKCLGILYKIQETVLELQLLINIDPELNNIDRLLSVLQTTEQVYVALLRYVERSKDYSGILYYTWIILRGLTEQLDHVKKCFIQYSTDNNKMNFYTSCHRLSDCDEEVTFCTKVQGKAAIYTLSDCQDVLYNLDFFSNITSNEESEIILEQAELFCSKIFGRYHILPPYMTRLYHTCCRDCIELSVNNIQVSVMSKETPCTHLVSHRVEKQSIGVKQSLTDLLISRESDENEEKFWDQCSNEDDVIQSMKDIIDRHVDNAVQKQELWKEETRSDGSSERNIFVGINGVDPVSLIECIIATVKKLVSERCKLSVVNDLHNVPSSTTNIDETIILNKKVTLENGFYKRKLKNQLHYLEEKITKCEAQLTSALCPAQIGLSCYQTLWDTKRSVLSRKALADVCKSGSRHKTVSQDEILYCLHDLGEIKLESVILNELEQELFRFIIGPRHANRSDVLPYRNAVHANSTFTSMKYPSHIKGYIKQFVQLKDIQPKPYRFREALEWMRDQVKTATDMSTTSYAYRYIREVITVIKAYNYNKKCKIILQRPDDYKLLGFRNSTQKLELNPDYFKGSAYLFLTFDWTNNQPLVLLEPNKTDTSTFTCIICDSVYAVVIEALSRNGYKLH